MQIITWIIFVLVYFGLGLGRWPGFKIDRAGIVLVGTAAILATDLLNLKSAVKAIDYETIVLLFSMMIIVAFLRISGFFAEVAEFISKHCRSPHVLLFAVVMASGVLSAFFVNDVVCLALAPLILDLCKSSDRPAVPYLLGLATASNIGSVATITGNPQNVIIGSLSHISYFHFSANLAPIALLGLIVDYGVILLIYRNGLGSESNPKAIKEKAEHPNLLFPTLLVTVAVVVSFFFTKSLATVAFTGAAALLLLKVKPAQVYKQIDWPLLMMFVGLFIVVHAFDVHVVQTWGLGSWQTIKEAPVLLLSLLSTALSNVVSNVPAVLVLKPLIPVLKDQQQAWLTLAMSSTLAGNLTILGSVANLVVIEYGRRHDVSISFGEYMKVGIPVTILTLAIGIAWLQFVPGF